MPGHPSINIYDLIKNFSPQEIRDVKRDVTLYFSGYKQIYAADTYDLLTYFLPYTQEIFYNLGNEKNIAQNIIAYENFFGSKFMNNIIIMDEYKMELLAIKQVIDKQLINSSKLGENINSIFDILPKRRKNFETDLKHKIELVIIILIFAEKGSDLHKKFIEFLRNKLKIFTFDSGESLFDKYIDSLFLAARQTSEADKIFDHFVDDMATYLLGLKSDLKRYVYLENTYRDIAAIDRLTQINKNVVRDNKSKLIFMYLSSAPVKTKKIFDILLSKTMAPDYLPPVSIYSHFNFSRNIFQCFLFNILVDGNDADLDNIYSILDFLERIALTLSIKPDRLLDEFEKDKVIKLLQKKLEAMSIDIENHIIVKVYNQYTSLVKDQNISILDNIRGDKQAWERINEFIQKEIVGDKYDIETVSHNLFEYLNTCGITYKLLSPDDFNIKFGEDIIKNSYQHLPYLLFINSRLKGRLDEQLHRLLDYISEINYLDYKGGEEFTDLVKAITKTLENMGNSIHNTRIKLVIFSIINLITVQKSKPNPFENSAYTIIKEIEVLDWLKNQAHLILKSHVSPKIEAGLGTKLSLAPKDIKEYRDINYVIIWLYRRNKHYDEGIALAEQLVKEEPTDPRFEYGLGLLYIAKFYATIKEKSLSFYNCLEDQSLILNSNLDKAIFYLNNSLADFIIIQSNSPNKYQERLLIKTIISIYNSLADIHIRRYSFSLYPDNNDLITARKNIDFCKLKYIELNKQFEDQPIYNLTEAEIEYFEALDYCNKGNTALSLKKLNHAVARYALSQKLENNPVDKQFTLISFKIEDLYARLKST